MAAAVAPANPGGRGGERGWLLSSPGRLRGPYLGPPRLGQCAAWNRARMAAPLARVPVRCESTMRGEESARRPWGLRGGAGGPARGARAAVGGGCRGRAKACAGPAGRGREGGKGTEGRGGEGRLGGSRRSARAGRRRRSRSFHSSLFGGTLFVSHNAPRGRPGWGRGGAGPG